MKISKLYEQLSSKYPNNIKFIKKGIFRIAVNEEAFFLSNFFNMKLTKLDNESIKIWFPDTNINSWTTKLQQNNLWYILVQKTSESYEIINIFNWNYINSIASINQEDYELTRKRILWLSKFWLEDIATPNFLLKDKIENIYLVLSQRMIKLPRKERYFIREKIERIYMDLFEYVYKYMYNLWERKILIEHIFWMVIVLREYTRFLYNFWKITNDTVYLDLWQRRVEVLKICKSIKNSQLS